MKIMWISDLQDYPHSQVYRDVIGSCEECDFDAKWKITTYSTGKAEEYDMERYFFG
jgi:hypothetical protein